MARFATVLRQALRPRNLVLPVAAVAVVATLPLAAAGRAPTSPAPAWTPLSPASVRYVAAGSPAEVGPSVQLKLLGFNDFHGNIDPPAGSGGLVNGVPAGGVEYLATTVKQLRANHLPTSDSVLTVAAGDNIGASPLVSAAFHDEPTIELFNAMGVNVSSVGNHEYDEGVTELLRVQRGGCHPTDGCQDGDPYAGAAFPYLAANVVDKTTRQPVLPPYVIRKVGGVKVAYIGETLLGTPGIVNPAGISSVDFLDEADTANFWAAKLRREQGVKAFVLLIHQGGLQQSPPPVLDPSSCANFAGDITPIVSRLDPGFGIVVSGHTHRFYTCDLPNRAGTSLVTSAGSFGVLVTDISATISKGTGRFLQSDAHNVIVENGVRNADGSYARNPDGSFVRDPSRIDPVAKQIADKYRTAVAPIANRVVGSITETIVRSPFGFFETPLGDVIADAQLAYTQSAGAQVALMNPGGIRADLTFSNSPGGEAPGEITYGEAFTVQPFNNLVVTQTFTGQQLKDVLEQQFSVTAAATSPGCFGQAAGGRLLQVSAGFTYSYDSTQPCGSKVSALALNGTPIDPAATYRVTTNDFLANGGDNFSRLTAGTGRATAPGFDVDALTAYLGANSPVAPGPANRITKIG